VTDIETMKIILQSSCSFVVLNHQMLGDCREESGHTMIGGRLFIHIVLDKYLSLLDQ